MHGFKRACPFEFIEGGFGPGPSKVPKEDTASIYEATLQKLRLGARAAAAAAAAASRSSPSPSPAPAPAPAPAAGGGGGSPYSHLDSAPREPQQQETQKRQHHQLCLYNSLDPGGSGVYGKKPKIDDGFEASRGDFTMADGTSSFGEKDLPLPRVSTCGRPCYVCLFRAACSACSHCSRGCCGGCCRRCERCQELFCSVCSTVDYEQRYDRSFCLDCGARASSSSVLRPAYDASYLMGCP